MKGEKILMALMAIMILAFTGVFVITKELAVNWLFTKPYLCSGLIWISYCLAEGIWHSYFWVKHINKPRKWKVRAHWVFNVMRACVIIPLGLWLGNTLDPFCFVLMQPFLHNGVYYYWRKRVDGNYGNWFDQSVTSTAFLTKFMTPINRTVFFVLGFTIYVLSSFDLINTNF